MNKKLIRGTSTFFQEKFNQTPSYHISSPGRINLIGEHIDYNSGSVLLGTIDKVICFAISKSETNQSTVYAKDMYAVKTFHWAANLPIEQDTWFGYIQGVLEEFKKRKLPLCNFNMVFSSNIPMGSGLSSSAALECGFASVLNVLFDLKLSKLEIVKIGQQAENNFAGVQCGIMDQFASVFGKKDHILQLNCETLETEYHRIQLDAHSLVLLNSGVKHTLLDSSYNNRREECAQGLVIIKKYFPHVNTFRDCTENQLNSIRAELGDTIFKRCLYVIQEINRVPQAFDALKQQDFTKLGKLLYQSHQGLDELYEVSCPELNFLVSQTFDEPSVLGSRMMGGGFGGCSINLIRKDCETAFKTKMKLAYEKEFNLPLQSYQVNLSDGTSCLQIEPNPTSQKHIEL